MATKIEISDFLDSVREEAKEAQEIRADDNRQYSDIIDSEGNQYVDLVQEGGGTLGIALVGYLYILEEAGIRFYNLAGTSAGAINTMMIATFMKPGKKVSLEILKMLSEQNLFDLVDGRHSKLIDHLIDKKYFKAIFQAIARLRSLLRDIIKNYGLNPGDKFLDWIKKSMDEAGVKTVGDLEVKQNELRDYVKHKADTEFRLDNPKLAVITSDVTTHSKIELPRMRQLFWDEKENVHPAVMVRASMSVPFFFYPFVVNKIPNAGTSNNELWKEYASYKGEVPDKIKFVDGGMLSNFPINVFHRTDGKIPSRPTFGARLSTYRESFSKNASLLKFMGGMVSTMRQIHDYDFLLRNEDYKKLICNIDADQEHNWLNFNLNKDQQISLFRHGAVKALEFLEEFDWEDYKKYRKGLS